MAAGDEELAGEDLVDESALVGGGAGGAHGDEVGDGEGDEVVVEAEDEAAEGVRGVAERRIVAEGAVEEVGGADAEVHEDAVGDAGVRRRGCGRGGRG